MGRSAFTLVELMVATSIACVIVAGTCLFFSSARTVSRDAYDEVTGVMSNRVVRENELFAPTREGGVALLPGAPFAGREWPSDEGEEPR